MNFLDNEADMSVIILVMLVPLFACNLEINRWNEDSFE